MSVTDPSNTTAKDICIEALKESQAFALGQTPLSEDIDRAQSRLQWMLNQWARKRWLVYHLVDLSIVSTGAMSYTIGPGGDFDTGVGSVRPARLESAFLRQPLNSEFPVDYPLAILRSREDYNRIALKNLMSWPEFIFLDTQWGPNGPPVAGGQGILYPWPIPQASIYEIHVTVMAQLPQSFFNNLSAKFNIPYEYYYAMVTNLAIRLKPGYGLRINPGDPIVALAKDALNTIRGPNAQIALLQMPREISRPGIYNIFSDRSY